MECEVSFVLVVVTGGSVIPVTQMSAASRLSNTPKFQETVVGHIHGIDHAVDMDVARLVQE